MKIQNNAVLEVLQSCNSESIDLIRFDSLSNCRDY